MEDEEIELNLVILEAIKSIAAKTRGKLSYNIDTITDKQLFSKNPTEKTFINIQLTKSL